MKLFALAFAGVTALLSSSSGAQAPLVEVCKDIVRQVADSQQAKARSLAMVDIDPAKVSLRQLRAIIGEPGSVSSTLLIRNLYTVSWLLGPIRGVTYATEQCKDLGLNKTLLDLFSPALRAEFLSSTYTIDEDARPISILITSAFTGAVRGLRITDPESKIIDLGSRAGFKPSTDRNCIQIDASWEVRWNLDGDPQNHYIEIRDRGYILLPN
jgi:hypothetical protein